jgi:hypothetical protein
MKIKKKKKMLSCCEVEGRKKEKKDKKFGR